jgi:hypothetical protein
VPEIVGTIALYRFYLVKDAIMLYHTVAHKHVVGLFKRAGVEYKPDPKVATLIFFILLIVVAFLLVVLLRKCVRKVFFGADK